MPVDPQWSFKTSLSPHAQTIWGSVLRSTPRLPLQRERWETPDGDFIGVDRLFASSDAPILIVLHGLESSSRSKQVQGFLLGASKKMWGALGVNFRSCSGEINRLRRSYHGGETSDLAFIIQRVIVENPQRPILCAGVSLGGNVLLKYLGEQADALPSQLLAAVAVSAPFDLKASALGLEKGFSRIYMKRLVASLRNKTLLKLKKYPDLVDRKKLLAVRTLKEFDSVVTAPVHGFRDANDYWAASSSGPFLSRIRRPTLLINAKDDPFLPASALPIKTISQNRYLMAEFPQRGGHVGFFSGQKLNAPYSWAEARAFQFFEDQLRSYKNSA